MADAVERITNLVALLLETRAPLTADQIATELRGQYPAGTAALRGAFERDKALLREIGVPLEQAVLAGADAGRTAYWIDRRRYELADLELADDERAALELAVAAARLGDAQFGLLKLGAQGRGGAPVVANVPELPALPSLRTATARHSEVGFAYRGTPRRLQPYALLLRQGFWYVIGHDVDRGEQRTFRVDRIDGEVEVGPEGAFERPDGFDPRDAFPSDPRLLGDGPAATATVAVDAPHAAAVCRDLGQPGGSPGADGRVEVEVPCANVYAFASWLFGWGDVVEVLGPPPVREFVVGWLRRTVAVGGGR
ncbi:MAG: WYL domain-containing protein [Ilumatobacteraceae bacterium]|nr:WYL domain-containing protein [Ilumatobacter sp.]MCB0984780.1 WYL domain-containing protein [Ilumatobacter sp.]